MECIIVNEQIRQRYIEHIDGLNLEKGPWLATVAKKKKVRSLSQNNLYWKWISVICKETGGSKDPIHEALMKMFLAPTIEEVFGELTEYYTTTNLEVPEFSTYLDQIQAFVSVDYGIMLPIPQELQMRG